METTSSEEALVCSTRQGVPTGLLMHYILHKLASKPAYGYELLTDIQHKTQYKWRPSTGSLYPLLKKMIDKGFIETKEEKVSGKIRKLYTITPKGLQQLRNAKKLFLNASERLAACRSLLIDILDAEEIPKFVVESTKLHSNILRSVIEESKRKLGPETTEKILEGYTKYLRDEIEWVEQEAQKLKNKEEV